MGHGTVVLRRYAKHATRYTCSSYAQATASYALNWKVWGCIYCLWRTVGVVDLGGAVDRWGWACAPANQRSALAHSEKKRETRGKLDFVG